MQTNKPQYAPEEIPQAGVLVYPSREAWSADPANAGKTLAAFDSSKRPKYWTDTSADPSDGMAAQYTFCGKNGSAVMQGGKPVLVMGWVGSAEAASLNIPRTAFTYADKIKPAMEIPIRPLNPGEELGLYPFASSAFGDDSVLIVEPGAQQQAETGHGPGDGFGPLDRALLQAIAHKLAASQA